MFSQTALIYMFPLHDFQPLTLRISASHDKSLVRGQPFDPEGGGGLANLVGTDYLFSSQARPENLFPGKPRTEYLFSTATKFFEKAK